jgi:hypothetical protein
MLSWKFSVHLMTDSNTQFKSPGTSQTGSTKADTATTELSSSLKMINDLLV